MMLDVANLISSARQAKGLSKKGLASKLGVSHQAVTKWESGDVAGLKFENLIKLCATLSLQANQLVGLATDTQQRKYQLFDSDPASMRDKYREGIAPSAAVCDPGPFKQELVFAAGELSDEGQALVNTQLRIAIQTAREIHGTRSKQTAA